MTEHHSTKPQVVEVGSYWCVKRGDRESHLAHVGVFGQDATEGEVGLWVKRDGPRSEKLVDTMHMRCLVGLVVTDFEPTDGGGNARPGEWLGVARKGGIGFSDITC